MWDSTTGDLLASIDLQFQTAAVGCSAGATEPWTAGGDANGNLLVRLGTGALVPLNGDNSVINEITSSADGRYLATASQDGTARIWEAQSGRLVALLPDGSPVQEVQFSAGSALALTVDSRGIVRVWDTNLGNETATLRVPAHEDALARRGSPTAAPRCTGSITGHRSRRPGLRCRLSHSSSGRQPPAASSGSSRCHG